MPPFFRRTCTPPFFWLSPPTTSLDGRAGFANSIRSFYCTRYGPSNELWRPSAQNLVTIVGAVPNSGSTLLLVLKSRQRLRGTDEFIPLLASQATNVRLHHPFFDSAFALCGVVALHAHAVNDAVVAQARALTHERHIRAFTARDTLSDVEKPATVRRFRFRSRLA